VVTLVRIGPGGTVPPDQPPPPPPPPPPDPTPLDKLAADTGRLQDLVALLDQGVVLPPPPPPSGGAGDLLWGSRAHVAGLPTNTAAYTYVKNIANGTWPAPNLEDHNGMLDMHAFAAGLVWLREGNAALRTKARNAIMSALPTFNVGGNSGLSLMRQIGGYVIAADSIDLAHLDPAADQDFRDFLTFAKTSTIGTHSWSQNGVKGCAEDAPNNWGGWAKASLVAIALYLGDNTELTHAAALCKGFMGDRTSWNKFRDQKASAPPDVASWMCDPNPSTGATPVNPACTKFGVNVDGAVPADISRDATYLTSSGGWPPSTTGIMYSLEVLAGTNLSTLMLKYHGYPDAFQWQSSAPFRMANCISRSAASGGPGWNPGTVQYHTPYLLDWVYGASFPKYSGGAQFGRAFGYTDWLYGPGAPAP
jgi:hypothetical protein